MAQAVRHVGDEVHVFAFRTAKQPVNSFNHDLDDIDILPFVEAADIVRLGNLPVMENHVDGAGVVFHEEPVTHVLALAVNRQRLLVTDVVDEERDELFGELVRTVVVRAVRHDGRHAVGIVERTHKVVGAGLGRGIRRMRRVLRRLVEEVVTVSQVMFGARSSRRERRRDSFRVVHLQGTVDFIGRDVVEALAFVLFGEAFPIEFRGLQEAQGAHDVRLREGERVLDGTVHMAFGREVDNAVDMLVLHELVERVEIADVHLHELVIRFALDVLEVREVARVSELVEVDDLVVRILVHEQANHVAPDKARTAGNDDRTFHKLIPYLSFRNLAQVLTIGGFAVLGGRFQQFFLGNPAVDVGDFLDGRNLDTLAVFHHLHELTRFDETVHRAGIEPCESTTEELHIQLTHIEVRLVEVRNFEFAAGAGLLGLCESRDAVVIEVKARDGVVALGFLRLFFDRDHLALVVEFNDTESFRVFHVVAEHARASVFFGVLYRGLQKRAEAVPVKNVVAEHHRAAIVTDEFLAQDKRLRKSVGTGLHFVTQIEAHRGTVTEEALEIRQVRRSRNNQDVTDTRQHKRRQRIINHRLVVNGQELFTRDHGQRVQARAGASGEYDSFHNVSCSRGLDYKM